MRIRQKLLYSGFFLGGFFLYLFTFPLRISTVILATGYFLLISWSGKWITPLIPGRDGFLLEWIIPAFTGLGIFQFLWFFSKILSIHHLFFLIPAAFFSIFLSLWLRRKKVSEAHPSPSPKSMWFLPLATLLICASITFFPFKNFGKIRNEAHHYRASFWAVSLKHLAVINAMNLNFPLENPYFSQKPFHYYYLSYTFPASLKESGISTLESFYIYHALQAYLFVLLTFSIVYWFCSRFWFSLLLTLTGVFSISVEGLYYWLSHWKQFLQNPWFFRNLFHPDAVSQLFFSPPPIDTLHRAILYTPMHLQSLSFLMIGIFMLKAEKARLSPIFMIFSFMASFFLGSLGFLFLLLYLVMQWVWRKLDKRFGWILAASLLLSFGFVKGFRLLGESNQKFFLHVPVFSKFAWVLILNFGLVLLLSIIGFGYGIAKRDRFMLFLTLSLIGAFFASFFVLIKPLDNEVPLKLGLVLQWLLLMGVIPLVLRWPRITSVLIGITFLCGFPTFFGDIYTAQDIAHPRATLRVPVEEMQMGRFIAIHLPKESVIQAYPFQRERFYSLIPTFAERKTAIGDWMHGLAFQISESEYRKRLRKVETAFRCLDDSNAQRMLRELGIRYILFGKREREAVPQPRTLPLIKQIRDTQLYQLPESP